MPPKSITTKKDEPKKGILVVPSRVVSRPDDLEGGEETEIAAQISVPHEGGWGWVVVFAAFWSIFILDGIAFTFGSIFKDMVEDLQIEESLITLINSVAIALYFVSGPCTSAFINRFGFRASIMTGSVIVSMSFLCAYFSTNYGSLLLFYGGFAGVGYCFINMASILVVGFYFERLRSLALSIALTGSSLGIMVMFPFNSYVVNVADWRILTLLHSGMFGTLFFLGMTYRPLLSLTVVTATDDPTRTVTFLPSLSAIKPVPSRIKGEGLIPTAAEKLFSAVSNVNFPTAAAVVDEGIIKPTTQPGPSTEPVFSKLTLTAYSPEGGLSHRQLKQVQSIISKTSIPRKNKRNIELTVNVDSPKKRSCWARLCHWEDHIPQSRPMYRDDAFFDGKLETLPIYQKSILSTSDEMKSGLEYQLAVSRAATTVDLQEQRGVFTTAARRTLATMMDPMLLKRTSFLLLCTSGLFIYLGYLVPYIFLSDRNLEAGIDPKYCNWFISTIGFTTAIGRLVLGVVACKISPIKIFAFSCLVSGMITMLSTISYNIYYQFLYCIVFGFFISGFASLRSMVLVNLYGLDKLTNATGMLLLFQGIGSLLCAPLASFVKQYLGYSFAFYVSGFFILLSGLCLMPVKLLCDKENVKASQRHAMIL